MYYVKFPDGEKWKVRQAVSLKHALNEISFAKVTGSIGGSSYKVIDGNEIALANVVRINSDYSEKQPY